MKLLISLAATTALLLASACAGIQARENVDLPAMKIAYASIEPDVVRGIDLALTANVITVVQRDALLKTSDGVKQALERRDIGALRLADWHSLKGYAVAGITSRNLGPMSTKLLLRRVESFHRLYLVVIR